MKHRNTDRTEEINRIAAELETLTDRLNELLTEENIETEEQAQQAPQVHQERPELKEGERVVITNNYKGQRGTTGTIVHTTTHQVSIRITGTDRIINKKKTNVRRI